MSLLTYLKEKGIRRAFQVIWRFKLPKLQVAIVSRLTRNRPLDDKIVIESHNDFDCNGGAFYNWLVENGYNKRIKIVWRLYHDAPAELPDNVSCVPVYGPSWRRAWETCTAKWLTADCTVAGKTRDDQVSVYMTHGAFGIKNCHGLIGVPSTVDYVLSPSPNLDDWMRWMYEIDEQATELVHLGFPSLDRLYARRHSIDYDCAQHRGKTILWMPTFRQGVTGNRLDSDGSYPYGVPLVNDCPSLIKLVEVLRDCEVHLVIKLHPKQSLKVITEDFTSEIEFITGDSIKKTHADNYDLMLDADAMVGDYSSAIYEYLILDRPVAFVLSDLAEYKLGLIDGAEQYMAGSKLYNLNDLLRFIQDVGNGVDRHKDERDALIKRLYAPGNNRSSELVAEFLQMTKV